MISRRAGGIFAPLLVVALLSSQVVKVQAQQCTLCADGSAPDMSLMSDDWGWSCTDLSTFAAVLQEGDAECTELQIVGFQDCACPTFPNGLCTLCPGGFSDIPDRDLTVPSTNNLTCGQILFVESELLSGGCEDLAPYRERCGCPEEAACSFCADGSTPSEGDRVLRYLTEPGEDPVTCTGQAAKAFRATEEQCDDITVAPVAVNGQAYCGCQGTFPSNLCTLCPGDGVVVYPDLVLPGTQGMTCSEMEDYLPYITDKNSCDAIAASSQACCTRVDPCPVCEGGSLVNYEKDKDYDPFGLTCEFVGNAEDFGLSMTCDDVQTRFPYFCRCPNVNPRCTLCQLGELPPDMDKKIPLLGTTCEETNDYASIRLTSECAAEMAGLSFDASAYCGCTGFEPPKQCNFCPEGQSVGNPDMMPAAGDGATCAELEDFANFVRSANLCSSVQASAEECCRDPTVPTVSPTEFMPTVSQMPTHISEEPTGPSGDRPPTPFPTGAPIAPTPSSATRTTILVVQTLVVALLVAGFGPTWIL